ncbi:pilus assembly protein CpaF [Celeribacter baekdonensis]|uniref:Pilus assembly protein CpaF n=1 Tax=Celeribacter baekdonensis TaxID=875171 RepID=A0A1G7R3S8_9RHOB|nr:CpaF family protein [Celeribacter baekdonensis]SDG05364.1 pilus assembly protein CpaF [Celeribacter baekdonensis]
MSETVSYPTDIATVRPVIEARVRSLLADGAVTGLYAVSAAIDWYQDTTEQSLSREMQRDLMKHLVSLTEVPEDTPQAGPDARPRAHYQPEFTRRVMRLGAKIAPEIMDLLDLRALAGLQYVAQRGAIRDAVMSVSKSQRFDLNGVESAELVDYVVDDMLGLGPLERLLADDSISEIMVNGPEQVYVERHGQLELADISFRDDDHVLTIATRIVGAVGRRVDETTPLVDARLMDGSRINVTIPPLAIDGPTMTIRKFPKDDLKLSDLMDRGSLSGPMADFLRIAAQLRLNLLVSGGTGSGKTTLLNAISREIPANERIVTLEDAAELRLQQPHVVRLETRPPNIEGTGQVPMRALFRNALRMRPDRIIIGEVRSEEAFDLLQAMNTGHDGSMSTLHANTPREALTRMENLIAMSGIVLPTVFVRQQLRDAIHLIVQISRMRDGVRRVTSISEIVGGEESVISLQELFRFVPEPTQGRETLRGQFVSSGLTPGFIDRAIEHGLDGKLRQIVSVQR